ncbi:MAG: BatA domain-containing protein [Alphaproteobacteria bacterium]|nr:BatA domain-containing protein [Alphaproteobacteria bacterium]
MSLLSSFTFMTPAALGALLLLPVIWWLLRFTPPRPETVRFPAIRLLLGLRNREEQPDKTPWWLLLLRMLLAGFVILGVSQPLFAPGRVAELTQAPLLVVVDDSWPAAKDWQARQDVMAEILDSAASSGTPVTLATSTPELRPQSLEPAAAATLKARAAALQSTRAMPGISRSGFWLWRMVRPPCQSCCLAPHSCRWR